jgi:cysteine desulfurase
VLAAALDDRTILVSLMAANNEVGTIHPVAELARLVHARCGALFHTDAVQAIGHLPLDVEAAGIDLLSISGHKICGPKGTGALYVRRRRPTVRLAPLFHGGGHERGFRPGTLNVPGIVGLGKALEIAAREQAAETPRLAALRDRLRTTLETELPGVRLNGHPTERLANNLNVSFEDVEAEDLLRELPDLAVSTGAACSSASPEPSHVLAALGLGTARTQSSLRFGLTRFTTEEEISFAGARVVEAVRKLRSASPRPEASS